MNGRSTRVDSGEQPQVYEIVIAAVHHESALVINLTLYHHHHLREMLSELHHHPGLSPSDITAEDSLLLL